MFKKSAAWIEDFVLWLLAVIARWNNLIGAGAVAAALVIYDLVNNRRPYTLGNFLDVCIAFVALGAFLAYRELKLRLTALEERPALHVFIENVVVQLCRNEDAWSVTSNPYILVLLSVGNEGFRSIAVNWRASLVTRGTALTIKTENLGPWQYVEAHASIDWTRRPPNARETLAYDDDMGIATRTALPISRGERPDGFLLLRVHGNIELSDVSQLKIECVDFQDNRYSAAPGPEMVQLGEITVERKSTGAFPPYGFKEMPVLPT